MALTYKLTAPLTVGSMAKPVTVTSLALTGVRYTTTPRLAPLGSGELELTLTDPATGWQETIKYRDASVVSFLAQAAAAPQAGATLNDFMAQAVFAKLVADGKLPAGTVSAS